MNDYKRDFLARFDGLQSNVIFCMWAGQNEMSTQRIQALWSIYNNTHCPIMFINHRSVRDWEKPESPYHPAFDYLSYTHQSDYIRTYLMHHYGGGWADIKQTFSDWRPFFDKLRKSDALALGYQELPDGIPHLKNAVGDMLRLNYKDNIGLCAFIFKRNSVFTHEWFELLHKKLDELLPVLRKHPATHPQDQYGLRLPSGLQSMYPINWADILGEIFHPIAYKNRLKIIQSDIAPQFYAYR